MNETLALYIETDYLMAAVEPLEGKFSVITKRGEKRFPFYFFIDTINNRVDYSFVYQQPAYEGKRDYIGNFLQRINDRTQTYSLYGYENDMATLANGIIDDIKQSYTDRMTKIAENSTIETGKPIVAKICFSDNINEVSRQSFKQLLQKNHIETQRDADFASLVIKQLSENGKVASNDKKYLVVEALSNNLNISLVSAFDEFDINRVAYKQFAGFGYDPRTQIIAKKIVDDINKQHGLLSRIEDVKAEYERQIPKASEVLQTIEQSKAPYISVSTDFGVDTSVKRSTTLSVEEIEQLTAMHIRQLSRFVEDHFLTEQQLRVEQIENIIMFGDTLCNDLIKREFVRFGAQRLIYFSTNDLTIILQALLQSGRKKQQPANNEGFIESTTNKDNKPQYMVVPFVNVADLKAGQSIRINGFDATPGKGASVEEIQYMGSNKFIVVSSTRSLQPNDIVTAVSVAWVAGIQIQFNVERKGSSLGVYQTRKVVSIELAG